MTVNSKFDDKIGIAFIFSYYMVDLLNESRVCLLISQNKSPATNKGFIEYGSIFKQ